MIATRGLPQRFAGFLPCRGLDPFPSRRKPLKRALAFVLLACAPLLAASASARANPVPVAATQQEINKAVAERVFEEIFNQGKFQVADEIYAPDFVNHGLHKDHSLQEDQAAVHWEKHALPDLKMTVDLMMAEGDLVTVVWTLRGTNTAAASPLPATWAKIEVRGITVWRIVDGRIREEWTSFDMLMVIRQVANQLKWQLIGLLCAAVIFLWMVGRAIRKLWCRYAAAKG
jgi:steroid delta-isomerase-like uncharacterized protein